MNAAEEKIEVEEVEGLQEIEILPKEGAPLKMFSAFETQLIEMKDHNDTVVFDLTDKKGMKEAKTHVSGVKKVRTALEKARKGAKANALAYGRAVDKQAAEIQGKVDEMILVHSVPIQEIEDKEKARLGAHEAFIDKLLHLVQMPNDGTPRSSFELEAIIEEAKQIQLGDHLEEFAEEAADLHTQAMIGLETKLEQTKVEEAEREELAKLRQSAADREAEDALAAAEKEQAETARINETTNAEIERKRMLQEAEDAKQEIANYKLEIERQAAQAIVEEKAAIEKAESDKIAADLAEKLAIAKARQSVLDEQAAEVAEKARLEQAEKDKLTAKEQAEAAELAKKQREQAEYQQQKQDSIKSISISVSNYYRECSKAEAHSPERYEDLAEHLFEQVFDGKVSNIKFV